MIVVRRAPPYATVQDSGRRGYRASGVPVSGAMDIWALDAANALVGNAPSAAALEWAVGAGVLQFNDDIAIALTGADCDATVDDTAIPMNARIVVRAGQTLAINRVGSLRFLYLAVSGGIDCPPVLGSRSTYQPAALGGIEGRRLARGDVIPTGDASGALHSAPRRSSSNGPAPNYYAREIRVIPAHSRDDRGALADAFFHTEYTVAPASDRTGYRLEGDRALDAAATSITSEPVCAGAIQLTPSGHPIVLMADSPTIGGYRILATVISRDLPIVAQALPGRKLRFVAVSVEDAQSWLKH